ncbi:unnamed protein product [Symbiodinium pilosum]|uniref:Uncharacterized protein n=1 Tax=Symbiodinium pilosum TaxID=2952 RepID=A0A812WSZ0_SYMPI|nr:unnamed protein product [Symbiodinium pilosum]
MGFLLPVLWHQEDRDGKELPGDNASTARYPGCFSARGTRSSGSGDDRGHQGDAKQALPFSDLLTSALAEVARAAAARRETRAMTCRKAPCQRLELEVDAKLKRRRLDEKPCEDVLNEGSPERC